MSFCTNCGTELKGFEAYCPSCGKEVNKLAGNSANANQVNLSPNGESVNGLASAVSSTKQRSRRKVPLIVLVALAMALAAGTAYAAYMIISGEIAIPGVVQQREQNEATIEQPPRVVETKEAALEGYAPVIADYKSVIGLKASEIDFSNHPYLNPDTPIEPSYAYFDINDDGIPELLIGTSVPCDIGEYGGVFDIWTYQNGEPVRVMASKSAGSDYIKIHEGGVAIYYHNFRSSFVNSDGEGEVDLWRLQPLSDENALQDVSDRIEFVEKITWIRSGSGTKNTGVISGLSHWENGSWTDLPANQDHYNELMAMFRKVFNDYKEEDSIEWHEFAG